MQDLVVWRALLAAGLMRVAIAMPHSGNWSQSTNFLLGRQVGSDSDFDDLGIRRLAAIGDSYSAGIGAGNKKGSFSLFTQSDWACSRYDGSYPQLINDDDKLKSPDGKGPAFEFLSCSGAVANDIINKQVPYVTANQNAILLSVGGNDAELTKILNACVFEWLHISGFQKLLIEVDFEGQFAAAANKFESTFGFELPWDLEEISRTCDEQLARTEQIVNGAEYNQKLDRVVSAAKQKLAPGGRIYWTGYARFFGTDYTPACDSVSWTSWVHDLYGDMWQGDDRLTTSHRRRMNGLVDLVNDKVRAAADRAGDQAVFIDYDHYVGEFKGRYCEAGVDESWSNQAAKERPTLMFYEMNAKDPLGKTPWKRSEEQHAQSTFEADINALAFLIGELDPGAQLASPGASSSQLSALSMSRLALGDAYSDDDDSAYSNHTTFSNQTTYSNHTVHSTATAKTMSALDGNWELGMPNLLPDGYGRVFHPTLLAHRLIANLVMWNMMNEKAKSDSSGVGLIQDLTIGATCPLDSGGTTKAPAFYARILPLGASIVTGWGSSNNNGFRKPLRDALRQDGWKVNMVGAHNIGSMVDNDYEGHPGFRVAEVNVELDKSLKYQPNIVVINAGTNDANQNFDIANFGFRYSAMLDKLQGQIPGVTIVVSTLIQGTLPGIIANRDNMNNQLRQLVSRRRSNGQKIVLADVDVPANFIPTSLITDGTHPNDEGHRRLAAIFHRAVKEAHLAGFISRPADTEFSDEPGKGGGSSTCDKTFGSGNGLGAAVTQGGSGLDDGVYTHSSVSKGHVWDWGGSGRDSEANITFARLAQPYGRHDMVVVGQEIIGGKDTGPGWFTAYKPSTIGAANSWTYTDTRHFQTEDKCIFRGVRFADVNADGLDDLLCISPNGDTYASINKGNYTFTGPMLWKKNVGALQDRVRLADIDGDGRKDYCVVADSGDIRCWRNGGQGDFADYWQDLGVVFTGKGMGDLNGVRFADINGDGRDDWLWVNNEGQVWTYVNNRGCDKYSLTPLWREASSSPSHPGHGRGPEIGRDSVHFVNVYNSPTAFGLGPRLDYVVSEYDPRMGMIGFRLWQNTGTGGTKLKSDGDRYCKMIDRPNSAMDYVWAHSTGYLQIYESFGGKFPEQAPYWGPNYIFWRATDFLGREVDRRDIHLADWDGDGLCDIIYVNPSTGGMDGLWLNQYKTVRDLRKAENWQRVDNAGPRGNYITCPERRGTHINDLAVRFADIDGNGRSDYLCIEKNGRTWGYLNNNNNGLTYISQFKKTENKDRANLRFVDVNGDGKADMLWVDKFNGDASVWYNRGATPASGSAFTWEAKGAVYQGAAQGHCEHFPDLDGNGRADLHVVNSLTNTATTWFNQCPGEGGTSNGDDLDTLTSPKVSIP